MIQLHASSPKALIWHTARGDAIPIPDLTDRHIANIMVFFRRDDRYTTQDRRQMVEAVYAEGARRGLRVPNR